MALVFGQGVCTGGGGAAGYLMEVCPRAKGISHPCEDAYLLGGIVFECANSLVECLGCYRVNGIFAVWAIDGKGGDSIWSGVAEHIARHDFGFFQFNMVCCSEYSYCELMQKEVSGIPRLRYGICWIYTPQWVTRLRDVEAVPRSEAPTFTRWLSLARLSILLFDEAEHHEF